MPTLPRADAPDLSLDVHGPDDGPVVLLVCGLGQQALAWPRRLVEGLTGAGVRVVTFDNRDAGASGWLDDAPVRAMSGMVADAAAGTLEPGPYGLADMAADGVAVLDHLGVEAAHVVGVSMGGMIAQRMAIGHPDRVASLTSVMSTTGDPSLPGPTPAAAEVLFTAAPLDDRAAYVAHTLRGRSVLGSPGFAHDPELAEVFGAVFDGGLNPRGIARQYHAILADGDRTAALGEVRLPALVVHGVDDPLVRVEAGRATAAAIPGAELVEIDGMGHDLPPAVCDRLVELLVPRVLGASGG